MAIQDDFIDALLFVAVNSETIGLFNEEGYSRVQFMARGNRGIPYLVNTIFYYDLNDRYEAVVSSKLNEDKNINEIETLRELNHSNSIYDGPTFYLDEAGEFISVKTHEYSDKPNDVLEIIVELMNLMDSVVDGIIVYEGEEKEEEQEIDYSNIAPIEYPTLDSFDDL